MFAPTQFSWALIRSLVEKKFGIIGIDFAGMRLPKEHPEADQFCAKAGTFIVENLFALDELRQAVKTRPFTIHTYPMRLIESTGLPCRVIAEVG